jgi:SAM-dependent methyltransferase
MSQAVRPTENLRDVAAQAYKLADHMCGSCRDLHALWPYIRLSRMSTGVEGQRSELETQLRALFTKGLRDILIAGCADTGLLSLVARAANEAGRNPNVVALDICETPLELSRQLAEQWSLPIVTTKQDLADLDADQRFDIALVHGTLHFMAAARRAVALMRMQRSLRKDGRLVLMFNTSERIRPETAEQTRRDYAGSVLRELGRLGVDLPDAEATFFERLYNHSRRREAREGAFTSPEDVTLLLQGAGFVVERCVEVDVPVAAPASGFISRISKRRFMALAAPKSEDQSYR